MPAACPRSTNPTSMARPPALVTSRACSADGPGPGVGVVVADEEVRRDRRELPERVEEEEVVGHDQADHRAGEQREQPDQAPDVGAVAAEVPAGVGEHEHADARRR